MNQEQLFRNIKKKRSFLCVGLDSEADKIPAFLLKGKDPVVYSGL
jgi:orotidine-5'-phosphate decarboxylase